MNAPSDLRSVDPSVDGLKEVEMDRKRERPRPPGPPLVALAAVAVLSAACGGAGPSGGPDVKVAPTPAVETAIEIIATDFAFAIEPASLPAGPVETTLINRGKQGHQAIFYRLNDGVSSDDFVRAGMHDDKDIPKIAQSTTAGVGTAVSPGDESTRKGGELEPGTYAVVCFIRDADAGKNHAELGMIAFFEVT